MTTARRLSSALAFLAGAALASSPTPLAPTASSPPELAPRAAPIRLELPPGEGRTQQLAKVSAAQPATFLVALEAKVMVTVGVSSPGNAARIVLYLPGSETPMSGTAPQDGAIRWTGQIDAAGDLRVVVTAPGAEIPFRVDLARGPGSM